MCPAVPHFHYPRCITALQFREWDLGVQQAGQPQSVEPCFSLCRAKIRRERKTSKGRATEEAIRTAAAFEGISHRTYEGNTLNTPNPTKRRVSIFSSKLEIKPIAFFFKDLEYFSPCEPRAPFATWIPGAWRLSDPLADSSQAASTEDATRGC